MAFGISLSLVGAAVRMADDDQHKRRASRMRLAAQGGGCSGEGVDGVGPMMIQRGFSMELRQVRYQCTPVCSPRLWAKLAS